MPASASHHLFACHACHVYLKRYAATASEQVWLLWHDALHGHRLQVGKLGQHGM